MNLCIASGKGGTGKTTIAVNLALALGGRAELLDCDVEEPNAHIFLRPEIEQKRVITTPIPQVDLSLCTYCGKCAQICRFSAIAVVAKKVLLFEDLCHSCGGCTLVCPTKAISGENKAAHTIDQALCTKCGNCFDVCRFDAVTVE